MSCHPNILCVCCGGGGGGQPTVANKIHRGDRYLSNKNKSMKQNIVFTNWLKVVLHFLRVKGVFQPKR